MKRITLLLTEDEADALVEDVTFDTNTAEEYGGHPASDSLLRKIRRALSLPEIQDAPLAQCSICGGYGGEHDWEVHTAELRQGHD
ncbi:MAG TPA: hypothetical protein VGJ60_07185 [Chloroflexota bacterium]